MHRWLVPSTIFAIALISLGGCASQREASSSPAQGATSASAADGQVAAYRNEEGNLLCPVMNVVIKSESDAKGYQDYEGKRYYFCCAVCTGKFTSDPARYAKK